jgi:hypothetical protein
MILRHEPEGGGGRAIELRQFQPPIRIEPR